MKKENKTRYCSRKWLNSEDSPSSGSIICYDGDLMWREGDDLCRYIEIADCQKKVRLHQTYQDTNDDFIEKVRRLKDSIDKFYNHLISIKEEERKPKYLLGDRIALRVDDNTEKECTVIECGWNEEVKEYYYRFKEELGTWYEPNLEKYIKR